MNYSYKDSGDTGVRVISGLSSEVKPVLNNTTDVEAEFKETDTGDEYEWDGVNWVKTGSGGVDNVGNVAGWNYGNWPTTWEAQFSGAASANAGDVIHTQSSAFLYNRHLVQNNSGTGTVDFYVSVDGTNYTPVAIHVVDDVTGSTSRSLTLAAGKSGVLEGKFPYVQVRQSGATAIAAAGIVGIHGVA